MKYRMKYWVITGFLLLFSMQMKAATLSDIQVSNGDTQARITLSFIGEPTFTFSQQTERVFLDISQTGAIQGLPLIFNGNNLVKSIHAEKLADSGVLRLVVALTNPGTAQAVKQQSGTSYHLIFTINTKATPNVSPSIAAEADASFGVKKSNPVARNPFDSKPVTEVTNKDKSSPAVSNSTVRRQSNSVVVVAIDAGHGGQDPGAIGPGGSKEKNVTIAVARKLKALLSRDPMFRGVLTRDGDYFISVMGRSDVARKQNANLLISIHADAAPNREAMGASVWVLSTRRANSEMAGWLEQHEKQSELLGGAGDVLANNQADPYLSQAVLDLQFGHSQRVGYDVASEVLKRLQRIGSLHKRHPEHASLGVLRSPDIPSLLVETGFISNAIEERRLDSDSYQQQIAQAIYEGLRGYFLAHPLQSAPDRKK